MKTRLVVTLAVAALLTASIVFAQRGGRFRGGSERPAQFATLKDFDGGFQFCRLVFRESPNGDGAGWNVDWPRADINLSTRLSELTRTPVSMDGEFPATLLLNPGMPEISHCPFIMMTEPGAAFFTPEEATNLRNYLLRGGFLWADDFWGQYAWDWFENQIHQVLPSSTYPIVDLPRDHIIFHQAFDAEKVPQIPGIGYWDGGDRTWERPGTEHRNRFAAINDDRGRIMVLMTFNTDFGDSYERETESPLYFQKFSVPGYAFGINTIIYSLTH
jgi:hypothetical protein